MCPPVPPGVKEVDYGLYPSRETQLQWLHSYLQAYKELTQGHPGDSQVSQEELETLYVQVNKFSLVSEEEEEGANLTPGLKTQPRGFGSEELLLCSWPSSWCQPGGLGTSGTGCATGPGSASGTPSPWARSRGCVGDSCARQGGLGQPSEGSGTAGVRKSSLLTARGGPRRFSGNFG